MRALSSLGGSQPGHRRLFIRCRRGGNSWGFIYLILDAFSPFGRRFFPAFITILSAVIVLPLFSFYV